MGTSLEKLCTAICVDLDRRGVGQRSIFLRLLIPPMLDTARITVRTIVTRTNEKIIPFPTMAELTLRLLTHELLKARQLNIVSDVTVAEIQVQELFLPLIYSFKELNFILKVSYSNSFSSMNISVWNARLNLTQSMTATNKYDRRQTALTELYHTIKYQLSQIRLYFYLKLNEIKANSYLLIFKRTFK